MKSNIRSWFKRMAVMLCVTGLITACGSAAPTFVETAPPESRIVVKTDSKDNCASAEAVESTMSTEDTRTQETAWWLEGKAGVGGKIPLGFLVPTLDVEAAITSHYGGKETRTWQNSYSDNFTVPGNSKSILAVFYQEMTRRGIMRIQGKDIVYEYPAEITRLGWSKVDVACNLPEPFIVMCAYIEGISPPAELNPELADLVGSWRLASPSDGEIVSLDIEVVSDYNLLIHVRTDGSSGVADWGEYYQCFWTYPMVAVFEHLRFKTTTITIYRAIGGELQATVVDRYIDPPVYIPPQTWEYIFTR